MLNSKYKTIFWTPCVAHCINHMLEHKGKVEWVKENHKACQVHHKIHLQLVIGIEPNEEKHRG